MKKKMFMLLVLAGVSLAMVAMTANEGAAKGEFGGIVDNFCQDSNPYSGDCLLCHTSDKKSDPHPGKTAYLDGKETGDYCYFCENDSACVDPVIDNDGDGYVSSEDCDDNNPAVNPGAEEDCTDGIDNDCDGRVDAEDPNAVGCPVDSDGDGYDSTVDCNDNVASINPGATEDCTDGIDNDCDGLIDNLDPDAQGCPLTCTNTDGDNYSIEGGECGAVDCDDSDGSVYPGATENCTDSIDNDCDNKVDCEDSACAGDSACLADSCSGYKNRKSCNADPGCNWKGKEKLCDEIPLDQLICQESGGRWNKKKADCIYR